MDSYFYSFLRNKISHEAGISGEFVTDKDDRIRVRHLKQHFIAGEKRIYIHPIAFRDEFLKVLENFENSYSTDSDFKTLVKNNLERSLQDAYSEMADMAVSLPTVIDGPATDGTNSRIITISGTS